MLQNRHGVLCLRKETRASAHDCRWLVRQGRVEEARHGLLRLTMTGDTSFDVDKTIAMIVDTNEVEKKASSGTSYLDCFEGVDLRRTEIV